MVQTAAGGTLESHDIHVDPYDTGAELGLDLRNDDGVATVGSLSSTGALGRDGCLAVGDVVRMVNGQVLFTCEAVVRAIKTARGSSLTLGVVRPPAVRIWRDEQLTLKAGCHLNLTFEVAAPGGCLAYRWQTLRHDVRFCVVRVGNKGEGSSRRHQTPLLEQQLGVGSGHVRLVQPGRYIVAWDNSYSVLRSKQVRYLLRLVPLPAWEAGCHVERLTRLDAECAERKARGRALAGEIERAESEVARLSEQLACAQSAAEALRREREENQECWQTAKAERKGLLAQGVQTSPRTGTPHKC